MKNKPMIEIKLDNPPSVNHIYGRNKYGGVFIKPNIEAWYTKSIFDIKRQCKLQIKGSIAIKITAYTCGKRDLDNMLKTILDALKKSYIIEDDKFVDFLQVRRKFVEHRKDQKIELTIDNYSI